MKRRDLLKGLLAAGTFLPAFARRALAQIEGAGSPGDRRSPQGGASIDEKRKVLAFLFLRGALDGLHAVPPVGEKRYFELRPQLALKDALKLDDGFGLHPSLAPLMPLWKDGSLAIVHAVGSPDPTRSHFDAQDFLELGTPGIKSTPDGWLARALQHAPRAHPGPVDAVAVSPRLPRALQGAKDAVAFASLDQLRLHPPRMQALFEQMYGPDAFAPVDLLQRKLGETKPGDGYPNGPVAASLRQLARLIKGDVGLRVACADAAGWDTHAGQPGQLQNNLRLLAESLAAFQKDLGGRAADVVLVAATEFGRTVRQNGALGTDHGHASVAFVLGGGVRGGRIHGRWPGLRDDQLYEGRDLAVTTDLRSVLSATAGRQLGARGIFPGFSGQPLDSLFG
ncbi:MAG TPA: DUF1501 domain-containing protein [Myxococcales bacterium]|nr:DUF1501 domain-containing protein [Myxococcales bacterium]